MGSGVVSVAFYAEITMALKSTGATTVFRLSNRPELDNRDGDYGYPILRGISGVGARMGEYLPQTLTGSLIIDNLPNSYGYERRFSDLFERYTPIDQQVRIYAAQDNDDDWQWAADWLQVYKGKMKNYRIDPQSGTLSINIESAPLKSQVMTKLIDPAVFTDAPTGALGRAIPFVIGQSVEVFPILVLADPDDPIYAYATNLSTDFEVNGVTALYGLDSDGTYKEFVLTTSTSAVLSQTGAAGTALPSGLFELAFKLDYTGSGDNYALSGGKVTFYGPGTGGAVSGKISIRLYVEDPSSGGPSQTAVGEATIDKNDYQTQMQAGTNFDAVFSFRRHVILSGDQTYWLGISSTNNVTDSRLYHPLMNDGTKTAYYRGYEATSNVNTWTAGTAGTSSGLYCAFYPVAIDDSPTGMTADSHGLSYAYFKISQSGPGPGQTNPNLSAFSLVVLMDGLTDDGSGTITGSAGANITRPDHVVKLLDRVWDGADWVAGSMDTSKFSTQQTAAFSASTNNYYRQIRGATSGRATASDLLAEVCANSGCRIAAINSSTAGKFWALYPFGSNITASAVLTDEDTQVVEIDARGTETLVNDAIVIYDRYLHDANAVGASAEQRFANYQNSVHWYDTANPTATALISNSVDVYGIRPAAEYRYDFIKDDQSAEFLLRYLFSVFAHPHVYIELLCPLFKYYTLDLFDVVEILHPDVPAYFGTSANASLPNYEGAEVDLMQGEYWKRAQRYRAQIEARQIEFNFGSVPLLRLTCRLLLNSPNDPT